MSEPRKHKVRDVAAARADREVKGSGHFGIASGGLAGSGDVELVLTPGSVRLKVMDYFAEYLCPEGPPGLLVAKRWITALEGRRLMEEAAGDLGGWSDTVDGDCVEIVVVTDVVTLRIAVFRCSFESISPAGGHSVNGWVIPHSVRLPDNRTRVVPIAALPRRKDTHR